MHFEKHGFSPVADQQARQYNYNMRPVVDILMPGKDWDGTRNGNRTLLAVRIVANGEDGL